MATLSERLERLWEAPSGALYQLRQGVLTDAATTEVLTELRRLQFDERSDSLPRRIVSLLWYMPLFIRWQEERVTETGGDTQLLAQFKQEVTNEIERLLGTP